MTPAETARAVVEAIQDADHFADRVRIVETALQAERERAARVAAEHGCCCDANEIPEPSHVPSCPAGIAAAIRRGAMSEPSEVERLKTSLAALAATLALYKDYVDFLNRANEEPIRLATAHGWRCSRSDVETGKDYRERIAQALAPATEGP